jgi:3-oxoacyl-[acyl-carrier-protein] synthase III
VVTNAELAERVDTSDEWIVSRTGIRERRFVAPHEATSDLAARAAERILADAGMGPEEVDLLIVPTCTPDHPLTASAPAVAERVGAANAAAYDLSAACSGFVYGLAQACAMVEAGLAGNVLVVGSEALSRVVDHTDRGTCILFGDGAGGALVTAGDPESTRGFLGFEMGADGSGTDQLYIPAGGSRTPVTADTSPADTCLQMNGPEVFRFATRVMVESATRLLDALELGPDGVDLVVAHQANIRIIDNAVKRLGIPPEKVFNNLERYGNTSGASIPLALTEARDVGRLRPGDTVLMVGFGAGLTWGSTVVAYEPVRAAREVGAA